MCNVPHIYIPRQHFAQIVYIYRWKARQITRAKYKPRQFGKARGISPRDHERCAARSKHLSIRVGHFCGRSNTHANTPLHTQSHTHTSRITQAIKSARSRMRVWRGKMFLCQIVRAHNKRTL